MAGLYYFKFFHQRFLASVRGWDEDQIGAYLLLLCYQYDNGSIPADLKKIKKISKKAVKNWQLLEPKFPKIDEENLANPMMAEVRKEALIKSEKASESGRKGGRGKSRRFINEKPFAEANAKANGFENEKLTTNQYPITNYSNNSEPQVFPIEQCLEIALRDERWVKANKATREDLEAFNKTLEKRGVYTQIPIEYKSHFANLSSKTANQTALKTYSQNSTGSAAGQLSLQEIREARHRQQIADLESIPKGHENK